MATAFERHLGTCTTCGERLDALGRQTDVVEALRAGAGTPLPIHAGVVAMMDRLASLAGRYATALTDTFTPPPGGISPTPVVVQVVPSASADFTGLLSPPQGAGELGRLGAYRVLAVLGAGGMGVVFRAEDPQLQRPVALKALQPSLAASASAKQRFLREARAAAAIKHDHIVAIYQVGQERGCPFLAMELLEGETLESRLRREEHLPVAEVLRIGREVADGLAAAHEKGLIHRDIKPANIWLEGKRGRAKILDFGLARAAANPSDLTQSGAVVGTPSYMAPEQAQAKAVDHRCDLFSLGVVLYRMATGELPFKGQDAMSVLMSLATDRPMPACVVNPDVPATLSSLIERLLAKDPAGRPASAQDAVEALHAIARCQPVPVSVVAPQPRVATVKPLAWAIPYRPAHRRGLLIAAGLLLLIGGGLLCQQLIVRFRGEKGKVIGEIQPPPGTKEIVVVPGPALGKPRPVGGPIGDAALVRQPAAIAGVRSWTVETAMPRGRYGPLAVSPDSRTLAVISWDGVIRLWDLKSGRLVKALVLERHMGITGIAWSPDGGTLAAAVQGVGVVLWDPLAGRVRETIKIDKGIGHLAWSPTGKYLAIGASDLLLWQADAARLLPALPVPGGRFAWSPDGKALAVTAGKDIQILDFSSRAVLRTLKGHEGPVIALAWSPDGKCLASGSEFTTDGTVRFWDPASGAAGPVFGGKGPGRLASGWKMHSQSLAWSPDSKLLATGGNDPSNANWTQLDVTLLDPVAGKRRSIWTGSQAITNHVAWSRDGKWIAASPYDSVIVYEVPSFKPRSDLILTTHPDYLQSAVWAPDARKVVYGPYCWDLEAAQPQPELALSYAVAAWSADGQLLAIIDPHFQSVSVSKSGSLKPIVTFHTQARVVALSPAGKLAAVGSGNIVQVWSVITGKQLHALEGHKQDISALAWSPDGKTLASGGHDGAIRLWDTITWAGRVLEGFVGEPYHFTWSPDNQKLAATDGGLRGVCAWRVADGQLLRKLHHGTAQGGLAWSADGKSFICAHTSGKVHRYNLTAVLGKDLYTLPALIGSARFSPDGGLLGVPQGSALSVWKAATGRPAGVLTNLRNGGWLALSPEGHYRGSPGIEREIVYVVQTEDGRQLTLTPEQMREQFGWTNDPAKVKLAAP